MFSIVGVPAFDTYSEMSEQSLSVLKQGLRSGSEFPAYRVCAECIPAKVVYALNYHVNDCHIMLPSLFSQAWAT